MQQYEKYKPSGIEWIGKIPEHWDEIRMRFIGYLYGGLSAKSANDFNQPGNIGNKKFIPFTNIASNLKIDPDNLQEVIVDEKENQNQVKTGDLFFLMSSENFDDVEKTAVLTQDIGLAFLNSFCKGFRITNNEVDPIFLNYHLNSKPLRHNLLTGANGYTRINLKIDKVKDLFVAIPPIEEQTAIANYLDRKTAGIDNLIAKKEKLLELYAEEKTAIINELVTGKKVWNGIDWAEPAEVKDSGIEWLGEIPADWEVKKFKYYFDLITEKIETNDKKIGLENIESKTGKYIETDTEFEGEGISFSKNDILFGKLRPYLAKVYLAKFEGKAVGDFFVFRSKGEVIPEFGSIRLLDFSFIDVTNSSTYGAKMPRVNWEFIANLEMAFPSPEEQAAIVAHIEKESALIDAKVAKTNKLIELLKEYRTALISEAVTGKIKIIDNG